MSPTREQRNFWKSGILGKTIISSRVLFALFFNSEEFVRTTGLTRRYIFAYLKARTHYKNFLLFIVIEVVLFSPIFYLAIAGGTDHAVYSPHQYLLNFGTPATFDYSALVTTTNQVLLNDTTTISLDVAPSVFSPEVSSRYEADVEKSIWFRATAIGPAFDISPIQSDIQRVPTNTRASGHWTWLLAPKGPGSQEVSLMIEAIKGYGRASISDLGEVGVDSETIQVRKPIFAWDNVQTFLAIIGTLVAVAGFFFRQSPSSKSKAIVHLPSRRDFVE